MELRSYWPLFLQDILEFQQIANAEQPEFNMAIETVRTAADDFFIVSLSEYGIKRWESILSITPAPKESLDERHFRIQTLLSEQLPFTIRALQQKLASLCGSDGYDVELLNDIYTLFVTVYFGEAAKLKEIWDMLGRILPANIVYRLISQVTALPLHVPIHIGGAVTANIITVTDAPQPM